MTSDPLSVNIDQNDQSINPLLASAQAKIEVFSHIEEAVWRGMSIDDAIAKYNAEADKYFEDSGYRPPPISNIEMLTSGELKAFIDQETARVTDDDDWPYSENDVGNLTAAIAHDETQRDPFKLTPIQQLTLISGLSNCTPDDFATPATAFATVARWLTPSVPGLITNAQFDTEDFPEPVWLVEGLILKGDPNPLWGDSYIGKTTAMIQAGVAIATGKPLFGRAVSERQRVILCLAEDPPGHINNTRRLACADLGIEPAALNGWLQVVTQTRPGEPMTDFTLADIAFDGTVTPGPFMPHLRALLAATRDEGVFVVLDTRSKFFPSDHSGQGVNALIKLVSELCRTYNATIVLNCHPSQNQMFNGRMTAGPIEWRAAVRSMLKMKGRGGRVRLETDTNFARFEPLALEQGERIFHPAEADQPAPSDAAVAAQPKIEPVVTMAIEAAGDGHPLKRPRGPSGYDRLPFPKLKTPAARKQWASLDAAVEAGLLDYRAGSWRAPAGYYPPSAVADISQSDDAKLW